VTTQLPVRISQARLRAGVLFCTLAFGVAGGPAVQAQPPTGDHREFQPLHEVLDLGNLGGDTSSEHSDITAAAAINDLGQVVGDSKLLDDNPRGPVHAFLWQDGHMQDLGVLAGTRSGAFAINNVGQIAGYSSTAASNVHAVLWDNGEMIDLGTLGGEFSVGFGINSSGQVVGRADTASGESHAFLWKDGQMIDLAEASGDMTLSEANAINDEGQIVGESFSTGKAFLLQNNVVTDLGALDKQNPSNASISAALAINRRGQIVGSSNYKAFLWKGGRMIELATLGGTISTLATALNRRTIVGSSYLPGNHEQHATRWNHRRIEDLNALIPSDSGLVLREARGINRFGQIVANGDNSETHGAAFLLTPVCESTHAGRRCIR
jgi:probable HAF family extracellular repeat protein